MKSTENFFNPHSVAIFASMKEGKTGYEIVKNMVAVSYTHLTLPTTPYV